MNGRWDIATINLIQIDYFPNALPKTNELNLTDTNRYIEQIIKKEMVRPGTICCMIMYTNPSDINLGFRSSGLYQACHRKVIDHDLAVSDN